MSKPKLAIILIAIFLIGILIGNRVPYLLPKETIYDKLNNAHIYLTILHEHSWNPLQLHSIEDIIEANSFLDFKLLYIYRNQTLSQYDALYVNIDTQYRVVWMELWKNNEFNITFVGFYFYSEPDSLIT